MLTREKLEERMASLEAQAVRLQADLNATDGALQQIRWDLEQIDATDEDDLEYVEPIEED